MTNDEIQGSDQIHKKTKHARIAEAHESTRKRLESAPPRSHEDHMAERGFISMSHYNLVHKIIPMPRAMKIPDAKGAVDEEWETLKKLPAWRLNEVKSRKKIILEAQKEKKNVHFARLTDMCHLKNAGLEPKSTKAGSCSEVTL